MNILAASAKHSKAIARIHFTNYKNAFFCDLGLRFLETFYSEFLRSKDCFGFIVIENKKVRGFVTGTYDSSELFSVLLFRRINKIFIPILFATVKKPKIIKNVIQTLFYLRKTNIGIEAELLSIAIDKDYRRKGMAEKLLKKFIRHLNKQKIKSFKVIVDKNNFAANKLYIKNGFKQIKSFKMYGKYFNLYVINIC